ncbi:unnamed protein product [Linum tenue]|uniref:Dirigent protein n=1 Tax=Linum tenue TaxID=586396 RepID=A0AAV0JG85_9ROSI|nr:unnamed protein product [Linum tenue]
MGSRHRFYSLLLTVISLATSRSWAQPSARSVNWAKRLDSGSGPDTITNIQFYFHDIFTGNHPTATRVVHPVPGFSHTTFFGAVVMADDPLTESADRSSKVIGRAQGMYAAAGRSEISLLMSMSYGFTDGDYDGSSLSIVGRNRAVDPTRELPVLGGTGVFRMARGYAVIKTVSANARGDAVVHYNVTVYAPRL